MSAGKFNLTIDHGSEFSLKLTVKEAGVVKNLTGYSARAQLRTSPTAASVTATFTCTVTNAAGGAVTMAMPYGTTAGVSPGKYYYDLEVYTGSVVQRLIQGNATVRAEVTR